MKIKKALISVHDKDGIIDLAKGLKAYEIEILSTGGTMKALKDAGIPVTSVSDVTGFPEILDGRVKTLHPKIHGGILARRNLPEHLSALEKHGIGQIDLVIVNLYPFEKVAAKAGISNDEVIENIDIGGPSMVRSAAKNFADVTIVTSPADYQPLLDELKANDGATTIEFRRNMAQAAFNRTASYDSAIASWFAKDSEGFPTSLNLSYKLSSPLRYGENPHQKAALYEAPNFPFTSLPKGRLLSGKELSFNNIWDLEAGLLMALDFMEPFAAVIKHTNPCGAAVADTLAEAYKKALDADPVSAYGSVIALNRPVDIETARLLHETPFVECILAPGFEPDSLELLSKKKNRRLLDVGALSRSPESSLEYRPITGGTLAQNPDRHDVQQAELKVVTKIVPTDPQLAELLFAFKIVKHIKSNAIVICKDRTAVGVGPGQTSRVESSLIAIRKAGERAKGAVAGSDAFFPMPDGLEVLAEAGVVAVIQPGGSKQDPDVIAAADRLGIAMVLAGIRHFKH
ncbi:MAG TPA: bifunctional phosphoribosylaminoimidazolecarboxamide formyltransferase/inosine monophosphate cyclohydrolase [candidate division Zixibacteria bacterium]|nr:bifunctional phosphoribosylaminoimidazolecarboxamide formyltransferase/inosine monophosphate cyclohydrolase [candidate division Zixibacteria bacterium]